MYLFVVDNITLLFKCWVVPFANIHSDFLQLIFSSFFLLSSITSCRSSWNFLSVLLSTLRHLHIVILLSLWPTIMNSARSSNFFRITTGSRISVVKCHNCMSSFKRGILGLLYVCKMKMNLSDENFLCAESAMLILSWL